MRMLWPLVLVASLAAFVVPGLLGAGLLRRRGVFPPFATALVVIALSCALGYAVFWVYFLDHTAGRAVSIALLAATVLAVVLPNTARLLVETVRSRHVAMPLVLMCLVAMFYNAVLFAHSSDEKVDLRAQKHLTGWLLPPDNVLPLILASHLYKGTDPRPLLDPWQSSDRPPLQAAVVLTQMPAGYGSGHPGIHYQLLSTALQCSWIPAVWALCGLARFARRATAFALAMAIFSGTFYVNSVFVWPKLLAGSLVVLAYVLLLGKQRPSVAATTLASASAGLALLAHAGVIFTLIPLAAIVVARRTRPAPSAVLAGAAALVVLLAPWSAYKLFYEPPGNQLAKMHLAGVEDFDDTRSLAQAMSGVYGSASLAELAGNRVSNVLTLVGGWPRWPAPSTTGDELTPLRQQEFLHPVRALGLLNLAWLGLAAGLAWFGLAGGRVGQGARYWRRRSLPAGSDESWPATRLMLAVAGLSIVVWVVLMFQPHRAVMHQGSFATVILLFVALAGIIGSWSPVWSVALVTVQVAWFTTVWAVAVPLDGQRVDLGSAALALIAGALCAALLVRVAVVGEPHESPVAVRTPPSPILTR